MLVPKDKSIIGTKWVFRDTFNEDVKVVRIKGKLIAKGYSQKEGFNFDETYVFVVRVEAIRLLLAYA